MRRVHVQTLASFATWPSSFLPPGKGNFQRKLRFNMTRAFYDSFGTSKNALWDKSCQWIWIERRA